jgi:hypothetical protein
MCDSLLIQNDLKDEDALSSLYFNFASEHSIRKVLEYQAVQNLNGAHRLLAYADDVNLLEDNTESIK